jgi:multiple sugar transport system permease protein/putative aldouronate transport system permease protein
MAKIKHSGIRHDDSPGDRVFNVVNIVFFSLFTLICIFPFYYLLINTISNNDLVGKNLITLIPKGIHFSNYVALKDVADFGNSVLVTVSRTILGTTLMVLVSAFAGYLTTKRELWHRSLWYRALVITMYFNAGMIPWYLNMAGLGLTDNYWGYIIPGLVAPYNIILVKTYIESIPPSLEESATIDGASAMKVFTKIILPLSKPILATIAVFGAVANWNSLQDSLILHAAPAVDVPQHLVQPRGGDAVGRQRFVRHAQHEGHQIHHLHGHDHPHYAGLSLYAALF